MAPDMFEGEIGDQTVGQEKSVWVVGDGVALSARDEREQTARQRCRCRSQADGHWLCVDAVEDDLIEKLDG